MNLSQVKLIKSKRDTDWYFWVENGTVCGGVWTNTAIFHQLPVTMSPEADCGMLHGQVNEIVIDIVWSPAQ